MKRFFTFLLILIFSVILVHAGHSVKYDDVIRANRLQEIIKVDGILSEHVWSNGDGISNFTQREPVEGGIPTQKTLVHVAYDDDAIYIGARMWDTSPDSIVARLGRKDEWPESDRFGVFLDPYHDKRSGYYFVLNAAGTLADGVLMNDEWDDDSWDGVWEGRVHHDEHGWTAELKIPYSQLRFKNRDECIWGINFRRDISRNQERSYLVFTPMDGNGFVSRFPSLVGIKILPLRDIWSYSPILVLKVNFFRVIRMIRSTTVPGFFPESEEMSNLA